jgi:single-strand DNA-binding protein
VFQVIKQDRTSTFAGKLITFYMAFEVEGRLHRLFPTEQKSGSFQAREFVLEIPDGNYPQLIKFQAVQDRCAMLDRFGEGDRIKVSFDLRGREWNGKYLTNLNAWRIENAAEGTENSGNSGGNANSKLKTTAEDVAFPADPFPNYNDAPPANTDDLPF